MAPESHFWMSTQGMLILVISIGTSETPSLSFSDFLHNSIPDTLVPGTRVLLALRVVAGTRNSELRAGADHTSSHSERKNQENKNKYLFGSERRQFLSFFGNAFLWVPAPGDLVRSANSEKKISKNPGTRV